MYVTHAPRLYESEATPEERDISKQLRRFSRDRLALLSLGEWYQPNKDGDSIRPRLLTRAGIAACLLGERVSSNPEFNAWRAIPLQLENEVQRRELRNAR